MGLEGSSVPISLISFLGFGLGEALEESEGSSFYPFVSSLPTTVPSSIAARLAEAVFLGFSFSTEGCQWLPVVAVPGAFHGPLALPAPG